MIPALILLALACAVLIGRQLTLEQGLHNAARRMREQMANETTARLALPCPSAGAEELLSAADEFKKRAGKKR